MQECLRRFILLQNSSHFLFRELFPIPGRNLSRSLLWSVAASLCQVWFGSHERADVQVVCSSIEQMGTSIRVRLRYNGWGSGAGFEVDGEYSRAGHEAQVVVQTPIVEVASLCAAAVAAAVSAGVPFPAAVQALVAFAPPKQRMHTRPLLLPNRGPCSASQGTRGGQPGVVKVTLIDDCYNANPVSMAAALRLLASLRETGVRCHAFLGDMLELGPISAHEHHRVLHICAGLATPGSPPGAAAAHAAARQGAASRDGGVRLGLVGPHYKDALSSLRAQGWGLPGISVTATEAASGMARVVNKCIKEGAFREGDLVLVKGSRGMRMDLVVNAFLSGAVHSGSPSQ